MTRGLHPNVYIGTSKELDEMTEGAPVSYGNHYGTISQFKDDP